MYHYLLDKNWEYAESGLKNPLLVHMLNNWKKVRIPHDYSMEKERDKDAPGGEDEGYTRGAGLYYKRRFVLGREAVEKRIWLEFEGISGITEVWVNGQFVTKHVNPYTGFYMDISDKVKEGENEVSLHTDSRMKPCSRWYTGAGIYRPVWLHVAEKTAVKPQGLKITTGELNGSCARLHVQAVITGVEEAGRAEVSCRIEDSRKVCVGKALNSVTLADGSGTVELEISVDNITPWCPQNPTLYTAIVTVTAGKSGEDSYEERFGIRTVEVNSTDGFLLNGQPVKLRGGCIHQDLGILGVAEHESAQYRKIRILKENGFNALRLSHNPFGPGIFKVCDELGMLVIEEAFDEWVLGRTSFGSHIFFEEHWEKDLEDMILRDYNHPSIIMWSTGNEVEERDGSADGFAWSRRLAEKVRHLDRTRPVSASACSLFLEYAQRPAGGEATTGNQALNMAYDNFASGVDLWGDATEAYFAPLDVAGYNYKSVRYEHDSKKFPKRVIYGSESYPRAAFSAWQSTVQNKNVIGDFVWTAWDYLGENGIGRWEVSDGERPSSPQWPWIAAGCADIDLIGNKRPQSYYRDAVWANDHAPHLFTLSPELTGKHIARLSWTWLPVAANYTYPGADGQEVEAHIYANADEVELFLNGMTLGRKKCGFEEEYKAVFRFPYEPGSLEVTAYKDGIETGRDMLRTASSTKALKISAEPGRVRANGRDLCFIKIEATDEKGTLVFGEERNVSVEVLGAELLALGTADPKPDRLIPYKGNTVPLYEGRALVIVQSSEDTKGCVVRVRLEDGCETEVSVEFQQADECYSDMGI